MQKLITFATFGEAQRSIEQLEATKIREGLFQFDDNYILIGGMGMLPMTTSLCLLSQSIDQIWSLGCAGALKELEIFSMHTIQSVSRYFPGGSKHAKDLFFSMYPTLTLQEEGKKLLCSEISVNQPIDQEEDLVDMEGYSIAYFAKQKNLPCHLVRCVSDFANSNTPSDIQNHIEEISIQLAYYLTESVASSL